MIPANINLLLFAGATYIVVLSSDVNDFVLRDFLISNFGWSGFSPALVTVTINSGVTIGATNPGAESQPANAAFTTGSFPNGSTLTIINNGRIQGQGGNGVSGGGQIIIDGRDGKDGGDALDLSLDVTIDNTNGEIFGGGGAGGGGGSNSLQRGGASGGGAGTEAGLGGSTEGANFGSPGTANAGGAGAAGEDLGFGSAGGAGGAGGGPGLPGVAGEDSPFGAGLGGAAGDPGNAIRLNGNIATFLGGGTSPNVEGAIS